MIGNVELSSKLSFAACEAAKMEGNFCIISYSRIIRNGKQITSALQEDLDLQNGHIDVCQIFKNIKIHKMDTFKSAIYMT